MAKSDLRPQKERFTARFRDVLGLNNHHSNVALWATGSPSWAESTLVPQAAAQRFLSSHAFNMNQSMTVLCVNAHAGVVDGLKAFGLVPLTTPVRPDIETREAYQVDLPDPSETRNAAAREVVENA